MSDADPGPYDLELIQGQCEETGLECEMIENDVLTIHLTSDIDVRFVNNVVTTRIGQATVYDDALIEFSGSEQSHTHLHQFEFVDRSRRFISMHYLDVISGLASGDILIASQWDGDELKDSWFVHKEFNDEFEDMNEGDIIQIERVKLNR